MASQWKVLDENTKNKYLEIAGKQKIWKGRTKTSEDSSDDASNHSD